MAFLMVSGANASTSADDFRTSSSFGNYLAARHAASEHNMVDASQLFLAALKDDPDNPDLQSRAFQFTLAAGDVDDAVELAEKIIKEKQNDSGARLALAIYSLKDRDYSEARTHIAKSSGGPSTNLTLLLLDAWAAEGTGDIDAALKDIDQVASLGGTPLLSGTHRAFILDLAGRTADADTAYRAVLTQNAVNPRAFDAYGRFLERNGRAEDAKQLYQQSLTEAALEPIARQGLKRIADRDKPDRLIDSPASGAGEALFDLAAVPDKASTDIAILYLRLALYLSPDIDLAKIILAGKFEALEKYDDAISVYRNIDLDSPYGVAAAVQVAIDEGHLDQKDKAISDLKDLARRKSDDITVWTALGDAYRDSEKWSEAADAYDHALKTETTPSANDWPLYFARGVALERAKDWNSAEGDLQAALKLSPNQPAVLNYLGYTWVDQGKNLPQALAMLEKARQLSPFDGYIIDSVGWAYYRLGKYDVAVKALEDAVLLVPGDSTINDHLGDAYWKIGRKLDAHFQWSHALAFGPDATEKPKIEKKLQDSMSVTLGKSR
jgi:tetratricopeptide (TPR) repeat protein